MSRIVYSEPITVTVERPPDEPEPIPGADMATTTTTMTTHVMTTEWDEPFRATGRPSYIQVQVSLDDGETWRDVTGPEISPETVEGLKPGDEYHLRVRITRRLEPTE